MQRVVEGITSALKNSIKKDCDEVEEFINNVIEKLDNKPSSIEEITNAKGETYEIMQRKKQLAIVIEGADNKNKLLRNLAGISYNLANVGKRWENFDVSLEAFNTMLEE